MLFLCVTIVTYVIFFIIPANPAQLAAGKSATQEKIQEVEHFLGLDQPVYVQYAQFMKRLVLEQSLGTSFATRQDVNDIVMRRGAGDRLARLRRGRLLDAASRSRSGSSPRSGRARCSTGRRWCSS